jgi:hypothetical protein
MSMKKILMTAVAVSALSAGAANAVNITAATVSAIALTAPNIATGAGTLSYTLANSAIVTDALGAPNVHATTAGTTDITATIGGTTAAGVFDPNAGGTNYSATYTLTNAVFSAAVTNASVTLLNAGANCTPGAVNIVAGGAVGTSSVTAVFNIPNTCSSVTALTLAPNAVKFEAPFSVLSTAAVTGTVSFKVVATDSAFNVAGVTGGAITLVRTQSPYTVSVTADTAPTTLGLASATAAVYSYLKTGPTFGDILGSVNANLAAASATASTGAIYADMAAAARPAVTYDTTVTATNGNFAVIKLSLAGAAMTLATPSASTATTLGTAAGSSSITAAISPANTTSVNAAQTYSATVTPKLAVNSLVTTPAAVTGALQTIALEGVSFTAAWIGGSQSSSSSYIRVSNSGSPTGQVTVSLLNPIGAVNAAAAGAVCTSSTVSKLASIAGSNELVIAPADLTACFGNFTRGDVVVTIQATSASLTAKARNVTASSVSELSLGAGTFN